MRGTNRADRRFSISKKALKQAAGALFRERVIAVEAAGPHALPGGIAAARSSLHLFRAQSLCRVFPGHITGRHAGSLHGPCPRLFTAETRYQWRFPASAPFTSIRAAVQVAENAQLPAAIGSALICTT